MTIIVCGQTKAVELAERAETETAVISITSLEDGDVGFPENPHVTSILRLRFNDLVEEYDEEGIPYGDPLPKQEDFAGLKSFVAGLSCEELIIHCWEGTSRSAAVAKAVCEFRGCRDVLLTQEKFMPNPLVYTLARNELGT